MSLKPGSHTKGKPLDSEASPEHSTLRHRFLSARPYNLLLGRREPSSGLRGEALSSSPTTPNSSSPQEDNEDAKHNREKRWIASPFRSPSESGTEADDEGYSGFVRALPPAISRPHKGLRRESSTGEQHARWYSGDDGNVVTSPFPTPAQIFEDSVQASGKDYFEYPRSATGHRRGSVRTSSRNRKDEDSRVARDKQKRKRQAELLRRLVELSLVALIAFAVVKQETASRHLSQWMREIASPFLLIGLLLALYPARLIKYSVKRNNGRFSIFKAIRSPATFDPAPLFYPTTVPLFVAASLTPKSTAYLLPNAVLCISALPGPLIPLSFEAGIANAVHWSLSLIPLVLSEHTDVTSRLAAVTPYGLKATAHALDPETIACLYFLHQALIAPLHYTTTTSLLPAELHLLSIALINLYYFATAPQAVVLKVLLWFGGLALFATCGPVVQWGITLARIPRWRLRRAGRIIATRNSFISNLNDAIRIKAGVAKRLPADPHSSNSEMEASQVSKLSKLQTLRAEVLNALNSNFPAYEDDEIRSELDTTTKGDSEFGAALSRSSTAPAIPSGGHAAPSPPRHRQRKRLRTGNMNFFLTLTPQQAHTRKWCYAGYIWLMILSIIIGPARTLVSRHALNGHEAIGWAISYVFGNVPDIRFSIVRYDLERWVPLPPLEDLSGEVPLSYRFPRYLWWIHPVMTSLGLAPGPATTRLLLVLYCGVCVLVGLTTVILLSPYMEVDTRRKVFHFTMVALLLPSVAVDPCFISLALALVLALFLLLELLRASQLPPLSKPLAVFLAPYVDGRDYKGPVVVSHIFLLIGCAIPLWLSLAGVERAEARDGDPWRGWGTPERDLSMLSGVICVGLGDAFASLVGRRFGRQKWPWAGGKSVEGSVAFAVAVVGGLVAGRGLLNLVLYGHLVVRSPQGAVFTVAKAAAAGVGASMMEAVLTGGNDNVIVPVVLWLLVRAVGL